MEASLPPWTALLLEPTASVLSMSATAPLIGLCTNRLRIRLDVASDSAGLELLLRFCVSNQVPGDAALGSSKALEGLSTNKGKH